MIGQDEIECADPDCPLCGRKAIHVGEGFAAVEDVLLLIQALEGRPVFQAFGLEPAPEA